MLHLKNIIKQFRGKKVIDNVSLSVGHGQIALLLGSSGVGKSTLLRILNNLETIDSGSITIDNKPLDLSTVNQTHTVGMVFQQFNLFNHLTVIENITLPLELVNKKSKADAHAIALELLKKYGLEEKKSLYVSQLSGGQKQRLAIARTLALKPTVICLDEPTSALDPLLTNYVAQSIQELAQNGYIVLVATHDTALIEKLSCTIYLMQQGTIVESAPSHQFISHQTLYPQIAKFVAGALE